VDAQREQERRKRDRMTAIYTFPRATHRRRFLSFVLACFQSSMLFLLPRLLRVSIGPAARNSLEISRRRPSSLSFPPLRAPWPGSSLEPLLLAAARFFVPAGAVSGAGSTPDLFPPPNNAMRDLHVYACVRASRDDDVGSWASVSSAASWLEHA